MRCSKLALGIALAIALAAGGGLGPAAAGAGVLYDQTSGTPGGFVPSEEFVKTNVAECTEPQITQDCYAADDFTVPTGPSWFVQGIHVDGRGGTGSTMVWQIEPGDALPPAGSLGAPVIRSISAISRSGAPKTETGSDSFDVPTSGDEPLGGVLLAPGHYWLRAFARGLSTGSQTAWAWQEQSPQSGYPAAWMSLGCEGASWAYLSACGLAGPDLRFRILGEVADEHFSAFKLGRRVRRPSGGLVLTGTFSGFGKLEVRKISGQGRLQKGRSSCCWTRRGEKVLAAIKIKPDAKTKAALKRGKRMKMKVAITFTREDLNGETGPPATRTLSIVLKKVKGVVE